ncbi:hypothetical protein ACVIQT_010303 [Bradyrhizobium diazoefficiens]
MSDISSAWPKGVPSGFRRIVPEPGPTCSASFVTMSPAIAEAAGPDRSEGAELATRALLPKEAHPASDRPSRERRRS